MHALENPCPAKTRNDLEWDRLLAALAERTTTAMGKDLAHALPFAMTREGTRVFEDAVALIADALGVELDEITFDADYGAASEDRDLGYMQIPRGTVSSIDGRWRGRAFGRDVVVAHFQWLKGSPDDAPFTLRHGYHVEVDGEPSVRSQFQIRPGAGWDEPDYMGLGMIMTAMPSVNAIAAVVAAEPGIATHATLPLVCAHGLVAGPF